MRAIVGTVIVLALATTACGRSSEDAPAADPSPRDEDPPPSTERERPAPDPGDDDPLAGLDELPPDDEAPSPAAPTGPGASAATLAAAVPPHGCIPVHDVAARVWPRPGPATIVPHEGAFVVGGYAPAETGGDDLFFVQLRAGAPPRLLTREPIEPAMRGGRTAAPALAAIDARAVAVAIVDGSGAVRVGRLTPGSTSPIAWTRAGGGADPRFSPAVLARADHTLVAWTDGSGTPMRVRLARVSAGGQLTWARDVTPASMGASAPTFAEGAAALLFIDARSGTSPIVRVAIGADGTPQPGAVLRPLPNAYEPTDLAAVARGDATDVAWVAVGNAATTAIGYVRAAAGGAPSPPQPIVRGTGYGALSVDAAAGPGAAVFAAESPKDTAPAGPREIHVRVVDEAGIGPERVVRGPDGTGRHPAIARASDGSIAVVLTAGDGVYVAYLRCDDA